MTVRHLLLSLVAILGVIAAPSISQAKQADMSSFERERFQDWMNSTCAKLYNYQRLSKAETTAGFKNSFSQYLKIEPEAEEFHREVTRFWNEQHERFICDRDRGGVGKVHMLSMIMELSLHESLFENFLLRDEEVMPINVNGTWEVNGRKWTLLDQIDSIIACPSENRQFDQNIVKELRETILEYYHAKSAKNLPSWTKPVEAENPSPAYCEPAVE